MTTDNQEAFAILAKLFGPLGGRLSEHPNKPEWLTDGSDAELIVLDSVSESEEKHTTILPVHQRVLRVLDFFKAHFESGVGNKNCKIDLTKSGWSTHEIITVMRLLYGLDHWTIKRVQSSAKAAALLVNGIYTHILDAVDTGRLLQLVLFLSAVSPEDILYEMRGINVSPDDRIEFLVTFCDPISKRSRACFEDIVRDIINAPAQSGPTPDFMMQFLNAVPRPKENSESTYRTISWIILAVGCTNAEHAVKLPRTYEGSNVYDDCSWVGDALETSGELGAALRRMLLLTLPLKNDDWWRRLFGLEEFAGPCIIGDDTVFSEELEIPGHNGKAFLSVTGKDIKICLDSDSQVLSNGLPILLHEEETQTWVVGSGYRRLRKISLGFISTRISINFEPESSFYNPKFDYFPTATPAGPMDRNANPGRRLMEYLLLGKK